MAALQNVPRLLQDFNFSGLHLMHGSDHHAPLHQVDVYLGHLLREVRRGRPDFVILNGDLFNASRGQAAQREITEVVNKVAHYAKVIYVPGNHCLRGAGKNAWQRFGPFHKDVYAPLQNPWKPICIPIAGGEIVAGNIFYDFDFVDPKIFGFDKKNMPEFYNRHTSDGRYLLGTSTELFPKLAKRLARKITPTTKLLITHVLPHPVLTSFRVAQKEMTTAMRDLERTGVNFIENTGNDPRFKHLNEEELKRHRQHWNQKSCMNGSNVLQHYGANPPQGMTVIYGHAHETRDRWVDIASRSIRFRSYYNPLSRFDPA